MTPASRSPDPPRAMPALPATESHIDPSGPAITVCASLRTTVTPCSLAKSAAMPGRSASTADTDSPVRRAISAGCGVSTTARFGLRSIGASHNCGCAASRLSASASSTAGQGTGADASAACRTASSTRHADAEVPSPQPTTYPSACGRAGGSAPYGVRIASGRAVCRTARLPSGVTICASPAPVRSAADADSNAAPAIPVEPQTSANLP